MERRNFAQILSEAKIDIKREYSRLFCMFYTFQIEPNTTLRDRCDECFMNMPFRKTCLSLEDFDETYGIDFVEMPSDFDLNYLINFCEYTYNLVQYCNMAPSFYSLEPPTITYMFQVDKVIDLVNYVRAEDNGIIIFVPKSPEALAVAEIVGPSLSYKVIEYNHHSLKGDLVSKQNILKRMADDIEPMRKELASINKSLSDTLFQMLNKFVRHSHDKTPFISTLSETELENIYDDIYQLWLLSKLELDNRDRKQRANEILAKIND